MPLIDLLQSPTAYAHPAESIQVIETHISWVILTGKFAYKIKKPVDLGFVDFSTFERRHHFCLEELRRNRAFSDDLYLEVVPITRQGNALQVGGQGEPIEYAVKMRQFDGDQLGSQLLKTGQLLPGEIDRLAERVGQIHERAAKAVGQGWGTADHIRQPALDNFAALRPLIRESQRLAQLDELERWTYRHCDHLRQLMDDRKAAGFVRECHGDLHLGNIVRWRGALIPFDCIEFNPHFYWIDVISEIAFLVMDLDDHERSDLGWRFLNAWLQASGDYAGMRLLPFYLVYRALVRAKVCELRLHQAGLLAIEKQHLAAEWHGYLDMATRYTQPRPVTLTITHGLSGSGKTWGTQRLIEQTGQVRIRSDVERKRIFGVQTLDHSSQEVGEGLYSASAGEATYERLETLARGVMKAGFPVVVDATFLKRERRARFRRLAVELNVPFQILTFEANPAVLRKRILQRQQESLDASDATLATLEHQLRIIEPLDAIEQEFAVVSPD